MRDYQCKPAFLLIQEESITILSASIILTGAFGGSIILGYIGEWAGF